MADDEAAHAVEIIRALGKAGLLTTGSQGPATAQPIEAIAIIGALNEAGLLATSPSIPSASSDPSPGPEVGDEIYAERAKLLIKFFSMNEGATFVRFITTEPGGQDTSYIVQFPPSDEGFLAEIDRIIAVSRPTQVTPLLEITEVISSNNYRCKLLGLSSVHSFPA